MSDTDSGTGNETTDNIERNLKRVEAQRQDWFKKQGIAVEFLTGLESIMKSNLPSVDMYKAIIKYVEENK